MLQEALANGNGEVDVSGFKSAIASSLTAPRARQAQGIPDDEWWKDPAALVPAPMLERATCLDLYLHLKDIYMEV